MTSPVFLTVEQVCDLLRVPRSCVYTWTGQVGPDAIPRYRAGKRYVFDRDEVLAWFKRTQVVGAESTAGRARRIRRPTRLLQRMEG